MIGFKRFTDLAIAGIPAGARLVVLAGPNGSGKSSLFDGLKSWHAFNGGIGVGWDETYSVKQGSDPLSLNNHVFLEFHDPIPTDASEKKRMFYIRTAFRNEPDFQAGSINRMASPIESARTTRLIDSDTSVSENYQRLVMQTLDGVYDSELPESMTREELRDRLTGEVRRALLRVFPDLELTGIGSLGAGTFEFTKGSAEHFQYKDLSAGEKAGFDLILDAVIKREHFADTIWCIDEPETHLNTRVQAALLETLLELLPINCQLFVASHSIGFMRKAWEMSRADPGSVAFIDMHSADFDAPCVVFPIQPSRAFWAEILDVALGDLASLMAPEMIVLCEGKPLQGQNKQKAAFDARCYSRIFQDEYPEVDFLSVGNSADAGGDRMEFGTAMKTVAPGTSVIRLIDRDLRNDEEIADARATGTKVLSLRNIEAYLLDDEVLKASCGSVGRLDQFEAVLEIKRQAMEAAVSRGREVDDWKAPAGTIYVEVRKLLKLGSSGQTWDAFAASSLAPLVKPGMPVYDRLRADIFG